jgi:long-chain acyl-CoA synthetase
VLSDIDRRSRLVVAVGPVKDAVKDELARAYVVRRDGADVSADELIDFTRDRLAAYKRPRQVVFLPSLPATSTGKIMRRKLADAHQALADAARDG